MNRVKCHRNSDNASVVRFDCPPPPPIQLDRRDIHVWCVDLETSRSQSRAGLEILSDDERARSQRFKFAQDRHRFIVGRASLRRTLAAYVGIAAENIQFCYGAFGKPALAPLCLRTTDARKNVSFNCTHSGGVFLCAVCNHDPIGVDIETPRPIDDLLGLAEAHFSRAEIAALRRIDPPQQLHAFFNCWTRKEAYIKATGKGLSARLDNFSVSLSPGEPARLLSCADNPTHTETYSIHELTSVPGHVGAIAAKGQLRKLSYWRCP